MVSFEKGIFNPTYNVNKIFDEIKNVEFKGSDFQIRFRNNNNVYSIWINDIFNYIYIIIFSYKNN